jgi:hypothetical protein
LVRWRESVKNAQHALGWSEGACSLERAREFAMPARAATTCFARCSIALLLLFAGAGPAPAQTAAAPSADAVRQAQKNVEEGYKLFRAKDYEGALPKLLAAYAVDPRMGTLKTIAICQLETKRAAAAYASFERLLTVHAKQISQKEKGAFETAILGLKQQTGTIKLEGVKPGAVVTIDATDVSVDQLGVPIRLDAGKHKISATLAGHAPFEAEVEIVPTKNISFEIRLVPLHG